MTSIRFMTVLNTVQFNLGFTIIIIAQATSPLIKALSFKPQAQITKTLKPSPPQGHQTIFTSIQENTWPKMGTWLLAV